MGSVTSPSDPGITERPFVTFNPPFTAGSILVEPKCVICLIVQQSDDNTTYKILFDKTHPFKIQQSYNYVVDRVVDVKNARPGQSTLTPTESGLLAQSAPSEAEAFGASSGVVHREAERAFLALIALSSDDQFLKDDFSLNASPASRRKQIHTSFFLKVQN